MKETLIVVVMYVVVALRVKMKEQKIVLDLVERRRWKLGSSVSFLLIHVRYLVVTLPAKSDSFIKSFSCFLLYGCNIF